MKSILNGILSFFNYVLFLISLVIVLYILLKMYLRLDKNYLNIIFTMLPYFILLVCYLCNVFFKQVGVTKNIFYNLTCCLVFITTIVAGYRSVFDTNMILTTKLSINYIYFSDYLAFFRIMLYGLVIGNIFLALSAKKESKEVIETVDTDEII